MSILGILTFVMMSGYWLAVFSGAFPVKEVVVGYSNWFMSFPVADLWMGIVALLTAIYIKRNNIYCASITGLLTGSSLVFLGLNALTFGFYTGTLFMFGPDMIWDTLIEIAIKIYCLTAGAYFIKQSIAGLRSVYDEK